MASKSTEITMRNLARALALVNPNGGISQQRQFWRRGRTAGNRIYPVDTPSRLPATPLNGVSPLGGRAK
jgi:hypothetical protein